MFQCHNCDSLVYRPTSIRDCPDCGNRFCHLCWNYITEKCTTCSSKPCDLCAEMTQYDDFVTCNYCDRIVCGDCSIYGEMCTECAWKFIEDVIREQLIKYDLHTIENIYSVTHWMTDCLYMDLKECWNSSMSEYVTRWLREVYSSPPENPEAIEGKIVWT